MVNTTGIGIGLLITAVAVAVLFITVRKFGLPLLSDTGSALGGFGKGITDFFDKLGAPTSQTESQKLEQEALEIFERQIEEKEQQSIDAGFDSVEEYERETDTNSIFNATLEELTKFNPPDTIGYGIGTLNEGRGIEDTKENRQLLFDIIQGAKDTGITDVRQINFDSFFTTTEQAFEGSEPTQIATIDEKQSVIVRTIEDFQAQQTPQGSTSIEGIIINRLDNNREFQVFSADSSQSVIGVIRETPKDPTKLRVDSRKRPTETASQRANRVFEETGRFVDESRGASPISTSQRAHLNRTTTPTHANQTSSRLSRADRLRAEAERASQVFDSRSISNF